MFSARAASVRRRRTVSSSSDDDSDDQPLIQKKARTISSYLASSHTHRQNITERKEHPDIDLQITIVDDPALPVTCLLMDAISPPQPTSGDLMTLSRTRSLRDPAELDPLGLFPDLPTKSLASGIKYLFAENKNLILRQDAFESQMKEKDKTIQDLTKRLEERDVSKAQLNSHLEKQFNTFEAWQQQTSTEVKGLLDRLDDINDRQIKDEDRNTNECRKLTNRLEHLSFRQTEYEHVQSNANDYKKLEERLEKLLGSLYRAHEHWANKFNKLANRVHEVEKNQIKEEKCLKELDERQHDFHIAQSKTNEELREYQKRLISVQDKFDDELQRRFQDLQTTQQNSFQELESRWKEDNDLWQVLSDTQTTCTALVGQLQQDQERGHEKCTEEIGRWQQQLRSTQEDWQRLEDDIKSTQGKQDEESAERFQMMQRAQEHFSEELEKDLKENQSIWKRFVDKNEKRWHNFETDHDILREDVKSVQEQWRSFERDQDVHKLEPAQAKYNAELSERQQELQIQLETCSTELKKHQAKQEKVDTEVKDRQLDNQFSIEECIKKLTNQQVELGNINVMFTTIKECSKRLNELNARTKETTPVSQNLVVETNRGRLPPSPTPLNRLEPKKREFINPPVGVSNGSSRSINASKKTNEEYREEARANSHLQRFNTPSVSSLATRLTPSTPTGSSTNAKNSTRSGSGNDTRPSGVGRDMFPSPKKRQASREIAPPAKRVMASIEVTSPARSGRSSTADNSTSPHNKPVIKKGTAKPKPSHPVADPVEKATKSPS